jgi:hypothetical protein
LLEQRRLLIAGGVNTSSPELPPDTGLYVISSGPLPTFHLPGLTVVLGTVREKPSLELPFFRNRGLPNNEIDSFAASMDAMVSIDGGPSQPLSANGPAVVALFGKWNLTTGSFNTELLSMDLSGGGVMIRESPTLPSTGQTTITDIGDRMYHIDSFFDVFTEISLDGGQTWFPSDASTRLGLVPETDLAGITSQAILVTAVDPQGAPSTVIINQPPVVDLNGAGGAGTDSFNLWSGSPVAIADPTATLGDPDNTTLASLTVALASPHIGDVLAANVSGTSIGASFNGTSLVLSGSDTLAHYQQVLRSVTYHNTAGGPGVTSLTINVVANDGTANSNTAVSTVTINQPPTLLHSFTGGTSDGQGPLAGLTQVGSTLYGTTYDGGSAGFGTCSRSTPTARGTRSCTLSPAGSVTAVVPLRT